MGIDVNRLNDACGDHSLEGGLSIKAELEPLGGPGSPVKPAVYEKGVYQLDRRWIGTGQATEPADVVVIDNVPSQANRLEAALERFRARLGLPDVELDLSDWDSLPPHLPRRISGFRFPHRHADAYLRDATLDGVAFPKTAVGKALMNATADRPQALLEWFPQTLLFGFWQSHLGPKRSQAKLARSWVSEVAGDRPATTDTRTLGTKGDPLNLSVTERVAYDEIDWVGVPWELTDEKKTAGPRGQKKQDSLSNLGHGQALFDGAPAGVSFASLEQRATLSLPSLRRIWAGEPTANAAARALLAALGIVAHVAAFSGPFSLRSGCELRTTSASWTWLGSSEDEAVAPPELDGAIALFRECVQRAEDAGLPVGSHWQTEPLRLKPNPALEKVIQRTWPLGA
jgi:CRISPR-associated protein Csb1